MNSKESNFPIGPIRQVKGKCIYIEGNDIDTDRIIPARFLKCISFESLGENVFADDRKEENGNHPFDQETYNNSSILIVNKNFGCGSSREHAPQALMRWGIRGIIGQSFAEIFYGNCLSIGIPCAIMSDLEIQSLIKFISNNPESQIKIDILKRKVTFKDNNWPIKIDKGDIEMLSTGRWDVTATLIENKDRIEKLKRKIPYLNSFE